MSGTLTREQALRRFHDHLGEEVYVGLEVGMSEVIGLQGKLRHPFTEIPDASVPDEVRDRFGSVYTVGEQEVTLPSLPVTITESGNGLDIELTAGIMLKITWTDRERGA